MSWHLSTTLRRIRNRLSFLTRDGPPPPERTERFCDRCGADAPHDTSDDTGYGWYAQMWRCRDCGRETVRVWPVGFRPASLRYAGMPAQPAADPGKYPHRLLHRNRNAHRPADNASSRF